MSKVLVVATSPETRGGITSVISAHQKGEQWSHYHCKWIVSHVDKGLIVKCITFFKGILSYMAFLPFAEIVHIHLSEAGSALRKSCFYILALVLRKKIVIHFHSFSSETTIKGKYAWLYKFLFSHADVIIVLSNFWKDEVNKEFKLGEKVIVVYNPCTGISNTNIYKKERIILYAGVLNQRKGYADLINAFSRIAHKYPDWRVVFAGTGELAEGKRLAHKLGIETQVMFPGWVTDDKKDAIFKESSIFCLPSYAEGFPMAVLDAWFYGLPVITTPVGGIPDVAVDGENMLLFSPGDIVELAEKLEILISDSALRERMSEESLQLARGKFGIDTVTKQIGEIYKRLLG